MIPVHQSTKDRVAALRTKEVRTYDEVLVLLLDEHARASGTPVESTSTVPTRGPFRRLADKFTGHADGDSPREQTSALAEGANLS